jgi:thioredoxin reductase (NADPH)
MTERRAVVIVGGGPAAYSAAIYAARANLRPLCIEGYASGGMLMTTGVVENYPGFAEATTGPEIMLAMREQAERFGCELVAKDVNHVDLSAWPFRVSYFGAEIEAEAIIVATGATAKRLELPSEEALDGRGVAYCAACDGAFFEGKRVAVVGGGDTAMDHAMSMAKIAREVVVIHRRDAFRAAEIMVGHARAHDNVSFLQPYTVQEILGVDQGRVTGVRLRNERTAAQRDEQVDGVFVSIGHHPATELFGAQLRAGPADAEHRDSGRVDAHPRAYHFSDPPRATEVSMSRLIRMDQSGHTTVAEWRADDPEAIEAAVRAFREELDRGYFAMVSTGEGQAEQVRELPVDAELVIMRLPISGG